MSSIRAIWTAALTVAMPVSLPRLFAQTEVRALQEFIKGKQLGLRSYSADEVTHYKWANGGLLAGEIEHGLEVFYHIQSN